ncbi:MAG: GNAT family N-acetyltransferase, partial [Acutalibacteraceae bacterium]
MKNRNIICASVSDYKALLRFEEKVFRDPFLRIMPKMYKDREKCAAYHRLVKSGNKIVGAYAAYPNEFITSHGCLKAVGIGSVAVSKKHRGEGIMSQMMKRAENE